MKEFSTLDTNLAAAFSRIATGELASKILLEEDHLALAGKLLKGRRAYKMLFDHFRIAEAEGAVLDFRDLLPKTEIRASILTFRPPRTEKGLYLV